MRLKTRICDLLGIEYPIIQGGMAWISNGELAAAVSEAGGLGTIGRTAGWDGQGDWADNLRKQIHIARERTSKPFSVNVVVLDPRSRDIVDLLVEEKVPVVTTAAGNPGDADVLSQGEGREGDARRRVLPPCARRREGGRRRRRR